MSRSTARNRAIAGFTLIEVLVALAILSLSLGSLGALIATSARGARSVESHLIRLETARAVLATLSDRDQLKPGSSAGNLAGQRWRVDISPLTGTDLSRPASAWAPLGVSVTVQSPSGGSMQIHTVRLQGGAGG